MKLFLLNNLTSYENISEKTYSVQEFEFNNYKRISARILEVYNRDYTKSDSGQGYCIISTTIADSYAIEQQLIRNGYYDMVMHDYIDIRKPTIVSRPIFKAFLRSQNILDDGKLLDYLAEHATTIVDEYDQYCKDTYNKGDKYGRY